MSAATEVSLTAKPRLLFFYAAKDGRARVTEGHLAQVLQRGRNHQTFLIQRIEVVERPDLARRFRIDDTPALCVVVDSRVTARVVRPRGVAELSRFLAPWLKRSRAREAV